VFCFFLQFCKQNPSHELALVVVVVAAAATYFILRKKGKQKAKKSRMQNLLWQDCQSPWW
jgi:preprotein translocase subunit YajC